MGEPERRDVSDAVNGALVSTNGHHNGHGTPPAELTPLAYTPKVKDWKFLQAYMDAIEHDGRCSHEAIAKRLGVTRQAVWNRLQNPAFTEWVNAQLQRASDEAWPKVLMRAHVLALRGSIDHMNFVAKTRGEFKQRDPEDLPPGAGGPVFNVNILVPRP